MSDKLYTEEQVVEKILAAFDKSGFGLCYWDSWRGFGAKVDVTKKTLLCALRDGEVKDQPESIKT